MPVSPQRQAAPPWQAFLGLGIVPVLLHLAILRTQHVRFGLTPGLVPLFKLGVVSVSAVLHWAIYGGLLLSFGLTLRPGREPLIGALARRMHGPLSEEMRRYTRAVTRAWCGFFALQLGLSVALFCFAPLPVWSFFVNILDIPMVLAMFAAEYACRLRCLRNPPRDSLGAILRMIAEPPRAGVTVRD